MGNAPTNERMSLYQQVLGERYTDLPLTLRRFHAQFGGGIAVGTLNITRGKGVVRNLLAAIMRLPSPGEQVPIHLTVEVFGAKERWTRRFGSLTLVTEQWARHGLLLERAGPLRFGFRVTCDETGLRFAPQRCWLLGVPLPNAIAPKVNAVALGTLQGWRVCVSIESPLGGILAQYEGEIVPEL